MANIISTDSVFSERQKQLLAMLADMMIPAGGDLPSAADPEIFVRTLQELGANESMVVRGLTTLAERAEEKYQTSFAALDAADRTALIDELNTLDPVFIQVLQAGVVGSYYQDDRVLLALGLSARSPHPGGYGVPATDWSLLDPVRQRQPFYKVV